MSMKLNTKGMEPIKKSFEDIEVGEFILFKERRLFQKAYINGKYLFVDIENGIECVFEDICGEKFPIVDVEIKTFISAGE